MNNVVNTTELVRIFYNTLTLSNTIFKKDTEKLKNDIDIYQDGYLLDVLDKTNLKTYDESSIDMVKGGTLEISNVLTNHYKVAALNFADGKKPGGWPEYGCPTQEENICRCSNMYEALITSKCDEQYYSINRANDNGGLCTGTLIYLPNVTVFKDDKTYAPIEPRQYDIITCPAPSCTFTSDRKALSVYSARIKAILSSAIVHNVDCIVLGAWGCGAFAQDRNLIARAFAMELKEYSKYFKKVVFAMRPTPNWTPDKVSTYDIFLKELSGFCKDVNEVTIEELLK